MGSYADIKINGHELLSWKNYYDEWYFTKSDRIREIFDTDEERRDFIGYRNTVAVIKRRLNLSGYSLKSLEQDFHDTRSKWIEDMNESLLDYRIDKEKEGSDSNGFYASMVKDISAELEIIQSTSFQEWIDALPKALNKHNEMLNEYIFEENVKIENEPLLSFMLSELKGVNENNCGFGGAIFPCQSIESYAIALMENCNDDDVCELDISDIVNGGWVNDFEDIAEVQSGQTTFHKHFCKAIQDLRELNELNINETLQRMTFSSVITAMEAYLSDMMKRQVLNNQAIKRRFVENYTNFDRKIAIKELFKTLDSLEKILNDELDKISFHNINTVTSLYKEVLLCHFPEEITPSLYKVVSIRHDIVHRNGKRTDGEVIKISQADVSELIGMIEKTICQIDQQILDGLLE